MRTRDNFENDPLILEAIDRNLGDTRDRFLSYTLEWTQGTGLCLVN